MECEAAGCGAEVDPLRSRAQQQRPVRSFHLFVCAVESDPGAQQRKVQSDQGNPSLARFGLSGIPEFAQRRNMEIGLVI
ncbi:hypothetical protein Taro_024060 [Colocasia esculenta]|uniref:Uncharacterized protein n=1 Tax=Colocasia esculenta TaxID=4460 RepID=A0A843VGC5_COLES|nr:hypothetical protein [Colocasia esculenta]